MVPNGKVLEMITGDVCIDRMFYPLREYLLNRLRSTIFMVSKVRKSKFHKAMIPVDLYKYISEVSYI